MDFLFWIRRRRTGPVRSITARITIKGHRKDFVTGLDVLPDHWCSDSQKVLPDDPLYDTKNERLRLIKDDVLRAENYLIKNKLAISPVSIYDRYEILTGIKSELIKPKTVPSIHDILILGLERKKAKIGIKITKSTFDRYEDYAGNFLKYLIKNRIDPTNTPITSFTLDLCNHFIKTLVTEEEFKQTYANKHTEILRIIAKTANYEADGWSLKLLTSDIDRHREDPPEIVFLTPEEIQAIEDYKFIGRLDRARDMLLALCEMGQHIGDYTRIVKTGIIETEPDGSQWITLDRKKTKVIFEIMISHRLNRLIDKYSGLRNLPVISGQKANDYIKLVADYVGIKKNVTTKIGRKTFCDFQLNKKGLDELTVARMAGLTNTRYLNHYTTADRQKLRQAWK